MERRQGVLGASNTDRSVCVCGGGEMIVMDTEQFGII